MHVISAWSIDVACPLIIFDVSRDKSKKCLLWVDHCQDDGDVVIIGQQM